MGRVFFEELVHYPTVLVFPHLPKGVHMCIYRTRFYRYFITGV